MVRVSRLKVVIFIISVIIITVSIISIVIKSDAATPIILRG